MKATTKSNKLESDDKMKNLIEELKSMITSTIISTMGQMNISKSSPNQKDSHKIEDPTNVVLAKSRAPALYGGHSIKNCDMWTLKHDIRSPKFCELRINTEIKGDTSLDPNTFYNHIKMCLNAMIRLQDDLLPINQSIKKHSKFE